MKRLNSEELSTIQGGQGGALAAGACYLSVGSAVMLAGAATGGLAWLGVGAALAGCAAAAY